VELELRVKDLQVEVLIQPSQTTVLVVEVEQMGLVVFQLALLVEMVDQDSPTASVEVVFITLVVVVVERILVEHSVLVVLVEEEMLLLETQQQILVVAVVDKGTMHQTVVVEVQVL